MLNHYIFTKLLLTTQPKKQTIQSELYEWEFIICVNLNNICIRIGFKNLYFLCLIFFNHRGETKSAAAVEYKKFLKLMRKNPLNTPSVQSVHCTNISQKKIKLTL